MATATSPAAGEAEGPTGTRFLVIAALCLAASIAYLSRNCLSVAVAEKSILEDLNCTREQMGWMMGFGFFMSYAICQIPAGWLGQTWGSRRVLPLFSIVWSLLTGLMAVATGFYSLMATYLGIGAAQAGIFPNSADTKSSTGRSPKRAADDGAGSSSRWLACYPAPASFFWPISRRT